jgi:putative DNA methylase
VAVLINKAMIEIPPKFAGRAPVGPIPAGEKQARMAEDWSGARGLAEDVRRYGHWMREQAEQRIGHLYPKVEITAEMAKERPDLKPLVGQQLTVIAWLWARTVRSPNPAYADAKCRWPQPSCCPPRPARRPGWSRWSKARSIASRFAWPMAKQATCKRQGRH